MIATGTRVVGKAQRVLHRVGVVEEVSVENGRPKFGVKWTNSSSIDYIEEAPVNQVPPGEAEEDHGEPSEVGSTLSGDSDVDQDHLGDENTHNA